MKLYLKIIFLITILLIGNGFAVTWYVSKSGNNTTGKSWTNALTTIEVLEDSMDIGDTVLFGSGRFLSSQLNVVGGSSSDYSVYGCSTLSSSSYGLSTISSGDSVRGGWTSHSGYIYRAHWTPPAHITEGTDINGDCYTLVINDSLVHSQTSYANISTAGEFYYNQTSDSLYVWLWGNANPSGKEVLATIGPTVLLSDNTDYVSFIGLNFQMGKQAVVQVYDGCDYVNFIHCDFKFDINRVDNNPSLFGAFAHTNGISYFVFRGCGFSDVYKQEWLGISGDARRTDHSGSGIKIYKGHHVLVDSCTFRRCGGHGVKFKSAYSELSYLNTIRYSTFYGDHATNDSTSMWEGGVMFPLHCGQDSIYGNIFIRCWNAIRLGEMGADASNLYNQIGGSFVGNNTIYDCGRFIVFDGNDLDSTQWLKYNVAYNWNLQGAMIFSEQPSSGDNLDDSTMADSNYWYDPTSFSVYYDGGNHTWSDWQSKGKDTHSSWTINPNFDSALAINPWIGFRRSDADTEMTVTYGGKTWFQFGAVQNLDTVIVIPIYTISGTITLDGLGLSSVSILGATTNGSGIYSVERDSAWSGTATPVLSGYTFSPASRTYTGITSNQSNQNYTATLISGNEKFLKILE